MNTEFETVNTSARNGDWIVQNNPNNPKERYVVKQAKFEKLYDVENPIEYANATMYQSRDTVVRKCVIVTEEVAEYLKDLGLAPSTIQEQMLSVCKGLKHTVAKKMQQSLLGSGQKQTGKLKHMWLNLTTHMY